MDAESPELEEQQREAVDDKDAGDAEKRLLASASKRVYTQIGRITMLEVLALDIAAGYETNAEEGDYEWDLTLSKGWLSEMAGLKSLKSLRLEADLWSKMGQAEMLERAAHSVLAIPELILLVSQHLGQRDLARCTRVCKAWSLHLESMVWTDFCPNYRHVDSMEDTPPHPMKTALILNLPHIRTIKVSTATATLLQVLINRSSTDPSTLCTNLTRLEIKSIDYKHENLASQHLATLFDLNPRLTHLNLPFEFFGHDAVPTAMSKLASLQHLSIESDTEQEDTRAFTQLLRACLPLPHLTELHIDMDLPWDNDDEQDIRDLEAMIEEASKARLSLNPTASKIKSLRLPSNRYGEQNPLPPLLFKSELLYLESCEIPWFDADMDLVELERIVRKRCSNLKHLTCPSIKDQEIHAPAMCAFISGCSGIEKFDSDCFSDDSSDHPSEIIATLASEHCNTLEDFDLTDCYHACSDDQQAVLSHCTKLRRFWVKDAYTKFSSVGIAFTDMCRGEWVCLELKELALTLNRYPTDEEAFYELEDAEWDAEEEGAEDEKYKENEEERQRRLITIAARRVYAQIGRLEKLERLELDIDISWNTKAKEGDYAWDLTLCKGWLSELVSLKNLRRLRLHQFMWSMMGQAEVEFMHAHWPSLNAIFFDGNGARLRSQSHWQWLLEKRPMLHFG
ncbi:hypothetical protein BGZ68_001605 [Mortierella alpina]|nr:hypothetical protein BGZ68_001605 [Mortierella alpina]